MTTSRTHGGKRRNSRMDQMWWTGAILLLTACLLIAGCADGKTDGASAPSASNAVAASPSAVVNATTSQDDAVRVVKDVKGEQKIPARPERIADLGGIAEELLIVGFKPIVSATTQYGQNAFAPHIEQRMEGVQPVGYFFNAPINEEAVLNAQPDLIILNNSQENIYEKMSKIAPTLMLSETEEWDNWRGKLLEVAAWLDRSDKAEQWLADYDKKTERLHGEIIAVTGDDTFGVVEMMPDNKTYFYHGNTVSVGGIVFNDLKLNPAEGTPLGTWGEQGSLETIDRLKTDRLILLTEPDPGWLKDNPVYLSMPSVQQGYVYEMTNAEQYGLSYTPIGKELLLDRLVEIIVGK